MKFPKRAISQSQDGNKLPLEGAKVIITPLFFFFLIFFRRFRSGLDPMHL